MSVSSQLVPLRVTISPSNSHYIYFPAEKDHNGRDVRRLIIFRESKVEYVNADQVKPQDSEKFKCYIKVGTKSKDFINESTKEGKYLSEKHNPKNKMNRVMDVWASKGWVFDADGRPLPSSLPAPSEQSRTNTDAPKDPKEKKKLFGNTLPPLTKEQIAKWEASGKAKDSTSISSNLPTSSKPTNDNRKRKDKKAGPFLVSDSESDVDSSLVSQKPTYPKSAVDSKTKKVKAEERTAQGKQPIRNEASNKAGDSRRVPNPLSTSSKPMDASTSRRGHSEVLDSDSDESLFVSQIKPTHSKSAADDQKRKAPRNPLAKKLFPSDEEDNSASLESRPKSKATGGKTIEPPKPAKKTTTNPDLAGDKSKRREGGGRPKPESVRATEESSRGTAKRRDDRSLSRSRPAKKPEFQQQGEDSSRTSSGPPKKAAVRQGVAVRKASTSTGKSSSSRTRTGNELAPNTGVYYKSKGEYTSGRKTWSDEEIDPNRPPTEKELQDMELEDAEKMWKKKHGTVL
ncbi:hypothetical protein BELL_0571g00010 [Botrytis elliptica]|uniref:Uncharacterized protein n=1 Tax=Botrytis elliptica TaxID=278938 RepID=A0A4Z1JD10_9HELO|nr:hypothetical protein EAE99_011016 [Botrytis elliptica]TGO71468.1 hypothetical protein BELL_0571g00010 [Botrytis elliptica]